MSVGDSMIDLKSHTQLNYFNLSSLANATYEDNLIRGQAKRTAEQYNWIISRFLTVCGASLPATLSLNSTYQDFKPLLIDYLVDCREVRNLKQQSIAFNFNALNSLFSYLVDEGITAINPVPTFRQRYLKTYKMPEHAPKQLLTTKDTEDLINAAETTFLKSLILLLATSGIRAHELLELDVKDFDPVSGLITLKNTAKRTNHTLPLSKQTVDHITAYLGERPDKGLNPEAPLFTNRIGQRFNRHTLNRHLQRVGELVGLHNPDPNAPSYERLTAHTFRHYITKTLRDNGMNISYVAEIRGDKRHKHAIQEWYYGISIYELKREFDIYCPIFRIPDPIQNTQNQERQRVAAF